MPGSSRRSPTPSASKGRRTAVPRVVDASVLGAFLFGEPRAAEAARRLGGTRLYAPPLLAYELASIARKKVLRESANRNLVLKALRLGLSMDVNWVEVEQDAAFLLAIETGLTTYDAAYLWLARALGLPLLTFDAVLEAAAAGASTKRFS